MKRIFLLPVLLAFVAIGFTQNAPLLIQLKCVDGKQIRFDETLVKEGAKISFDASDLPCCTGKKLTVMLDRGSGPEDLKGTKTTPPVFTMPEEDVILLFECGAIKGRGTIKVDGPTDQSSVFGNPLQDALQLSALWKKINSPNGAAAEQAAIDLLEQYGIVAKDYQDINYLKDYVRLNKAKEKVVGPPPATEAFLGKSAVAAGSDLSGIFSPTLVIDALGKFAAKRFKEELTIGFLQKFRDSLMSEKYHELRALMPRSYNTLQSADVFNFTQFYQSLHENAQTDLYNLPENLGGLVRANSGLIKPELYPAILGSLDLVKSLEQRMPAASAIEFLAYRDYVDLNQPTLYFSGVRFLGICSKRLHNWESVPTATGWADEKYLAQMVSDKDAFNFWMALLLKQEGLELSKIDIKGDSLYNILNSRLPEFESRVRQIVAHFATVQAAARQLLDLSRTDSLAERDLFFQYSNAMFGVLNAVVELTKTIDPKINIGELARTLKAGQELTAFAHSKRFGDAVSVALEIIRIIYTCNNTIANTPPVLYDEFLAHYKQTQNTYYKAQKAFKKAQKTTDQMLITQARAYRDKARATYDAVILEKKTIKQKALVAEAQNLLNTATNPEAAEHIRVMELLSRIDKYGNLLVSLANAENSDQLLAVLEQAAEPTQSYRKKRGAGHFSATINMYPGIALGREFELDSIGKFSHAKGDIVAFTTPIGLSLNWGFGKKQSLSVFFSAIDIGAVTAFRLTDSASRLPELKWKNVFAPGAYVMWGIGQTPLTLGIGGQYGPALRKIGKDPATGADIKAANFRLGASLTVDIPIFKVN